MCNVDNVLLYSLHGVYFAAHNTGMGTRIWYGYNINWYNINWYGWSLLGRKLPSNPCIHPVMPLQQLRKLSNRYVLQLHPPVTFRTVCFLPSPLLNWHCWICLRFQPILCIALFFLAQFAFSDFPDSLFQDAVDKETKGEAVAAWVGAAFAFGAGIWYFLGPEKAEEYFAGYVLEQSLSVDNLFVFILVFNYFQTPPEYQPKVLTYGIITAAALRLVMILLGVELVESFKPVLLGFAALLLYSSYKLVLDNEEEEEVRTSQCESAESVHSWSCYVAWGVASGQTPFSFERSATYC